MRHKLVAVFGLITLAGTSPAWATATLFCEASDKKVEFQIMGVVPHGQGEPLTQTHGELTSHFDGDDVTDNLVDENRTQYSLDQTNLNLVFYLESEVGIPFAWTQLTIKTTVRADDDVYFDGTFHFESYQAPVDAKHEETEHKADGTVTCSVG